MPDPGQGRGNPDHDACKNAADTGKLYLELETAIWCECFFDRVHRVCTWAALPPDDPLGSE